MTSPEGHGWTRGSGRAPACRAARGLAGLLLGVLLTGCPPTIPPPPNALQDPQQVHLAVQARAASLQSVRGEAKVELFSEEGYTPFSLVAVAARPDRLHLEVLSPFDMPLGILTADTGSFQLYSLEEKLFLHGPASAENIARLIPLPLPPAELVELLLGSVPLLPDPQELRWDPTRGCYELQVALAEGPRQRLWLDPRDLTPRESRYESPTGELLYRLQLEEPSTLPGHPGVRLPRLIKVEMPAREIELSLRWQDRELNVEIPPAAWTQQPPRGAEVRRLP